MVPTKPLVWFLSWQTLRGMKLHILTSINIYVICQGEGLGPYNKKTITAGWLRVYYDRHITKERRIWLTAVWLIGE